MTIPVKQHKTHLLWTAQTQLESNHHLNSMLTADFALHKKFHDFYSAKRKRSF